MNLWKIAEIIDDLTAEEGDDEIVIDILFIILFHIGNIFNGNGSPVFIKS